MTDLAQVVATADIFPNMAQDRAAAIHEAYTAEAARQRALAINARSDDDRQAAQKLAGDAQAAADNDIRSYDGHEALLKDPEIDAVLVLTTPPVRGGARRCRGSSWQAHLHRRADGQERAGG